MKTVGIVIARMGSTRLPGKVLMDLAGSAVLGWSVWSLLESDIDELWVATSTLEQDNKIVEWCVRHKVNVFRGSETDVLSRFYECAKQAHADVVVRVTGDCPFIDPMVVSQVVRLRAITGADYASNIDPPTWPDGLDCEVFTFKALEEAHRHTERTTDRDCVTTYIRRNKHSFKCENLVCPLPGLDKERWVLDDANDYEFCQAVAKHYPTSHLHILKILNRNPEYRDINKSGIRNERYYEAVAQEYPQRTFGASQAWLENARKTIPLGAQTFSKSYVQYPAGHAPIYCTHGDGPYLFDIDGNDYVDLVSGLMPVVLGYRDPDVDSAIRRQLNNGITFSLSTELEANLAKTLCRLIPCAQMARFGKNGSDVTAAAVRLARAYTPRRDHIILSGYHGWHDWSIGPTERSLGIPEDTYCLSHMLPRGDREAIEKLAAIRHNVVSAIIVEPDGNPDFLRWLRKFCDERGIVLIFDEIITGFRYSLGGGQQFYGVTPDLACFGKAMGNGMPISAIVGRKDIMKLCEPPDNIFYSGTMFGETLSIAASIACLKKMEENDVPQRMLLAGVKLDKALNKIPEVELYGHPARLRIKYANNKIKTLYMREMIARGVLIIDSFNLTYAHNESALKRVVDAHNTVCALIAKAIETGTVDMAIGNTPVLGQVSVRAYERT